MAMTKIKKESNRKKAKAFSIKTGVAEDFDTICNFNEEVPSHVVERLMQAFIDKFNKKNGGNGNQPS